MALLRLRPHYQRPPKARWQAIAEGTHYRRLELGDIGGILPLEDWWKGDQIRAGDQSYDRQVLGITIRLAFPLMTLVADHPLPGQDA
jgi:hypothetical protein